MNALTGWKLAALAALLVLALLGGAVPLLWKRLRDSPVALSHLNTFSGGVFFAMALGHLLPDAVEAFEKLNISFRATPYTIALGGYLFILFVEKIIVDAHAFAHGHDDDGHSRTPSIHEPAAQSPIESACVRVPNITLPPPPKLVLGAHSDHLVNAAQPSEHVSRLIAPDSPLAESHPAARRRFLAQAALLPPEEICCDADDECHDSACAESGILSTCEFSAAPGTHSHAGTPTSAPHRHAQHHHHRVIAQPDTPLLSQPATVVPVPASEHEHHHHHHNEADSAPATVASAYVLMIALSLHAVFEGIALGLQDSVGKVFTLAIGLMAHKWVEAIALATSLIKSKRSSSLSLTFMLIFAMASPLGVALGIVLSMENSKLIEASFTALACGSFLYVGANEVVSEEFEPQAYRQSKFACLVFGIALIIALTTLEAD